MRKKLLLWLFRKDPMLLFDILCQDFIGIIPSKSVDNLALDLLARNRSTFEPWLIRLAYTLQKENVTQRQNLHKDEFYNGALFVIRLLYSRTNKDLPVQMPAEQKQEITKNPQGDVENFLSGMKEKAHGQKDGESAKSEGSKV